MALNLNFNLRRWSKLLGRRWRKKQVPAAYERFLRISCLKSCTTFHPKKTSSAVRLRGTLSLAKNCRSFFGSVVTEKKRRKRRPSRLLWRTNAVSRPESFLSGLFDFCLSDSDILCLPCMGCVECVAADGRDPRREGEPTWNCLTFSSW